MAAAASMVNGHADPAGNIFRKVEK